MAEKVSARAEHKRVYVLDTTAFIAKLPLYAPQDYEMYTTRQVLEEVRDKDSLAGLELVLSINRIQVVSPSHKYVVRVRAEAVRHGLHTSLSETDVTVLALALELREESKADVAIVTDDYTVQNMAKLLGLDFTPLRTRGIKSVVTYTVQCPACGYVSTRLDEQVCPVCGARLKRVPRNTVHV